MKDNGVGLVWFSMPKKVIFWYFKAEAIRFGLTDESINGVATAYRFD